MKPFSTLLPIILVSCLCATPSAAQEDVIEKAMRDELARNMAKLREPDSIAPFFIMYGLIDRHDWNVAATQGALESSGESHSRRLSNQRLLVGDYAFNDESFDNLGAGDEFRFNMVSSVLPVEDNSLAIRRALWYSTDRLFRGACYQFRKSKEVLADLGKTINQVPHRYFAKAKPVQIVQQLEPVHFDKKQWETEVARLSALFAGDPAMRSSSVNASYWEGYDYLLTSEGTYAKVARQRMTLTATYRASDDEGEVFSDQLVFRARTPSGIPAEADLEAGIRSLIEARKTRMSATPMTEDYEGPVLLLGSAVADAAGVMLFQQEGLTASHYIPPLQGIRLMHAPPSIESRIEKQVVDPSLTIIAHPGRKMFNGVALAGSFEIDDEGMTPTDSLVLIDHGVLKALLHDRTLTSAKQVANGYNNGPGVLEIHSTSTFTDKELREKLREAARKAGLEYGVIVQESMAGDNGFETFGNGGLATRLYVSDGHEEVIRQAQLSHQGLKNLKNVLGVSKDLRASYFTFGRLGRMPMYMNFEGANESLAQSFSVIAPAAMLLEEASLSPAPSFSTQEKEYVPSPLKK